jgi:hypothetical protein
MPSDSIGIDTKDAYIPSWFLALSTFMLCSFWVLFLYSFSLPINTTVYSISIQLVRYLLFVIGIPFTLIQIRAWKNPRDKNLFSVFMVIRKGRKIVFIVGWVILIIWVREQFPPTTLVGIIKYINATILVLIGHFLKPVPQQYEGLPPSLNNKITRVNTYLKKFEEAIPNWVFIVLVASLPALVTFGLLNFGLNAKISDFRPAYWNDQVGYWHEARTFSQYGFKGGYYGWDEKPALAKFNRYDVTGLAYPMIFGTVGRIVGWFSYLPIFLNMGLLAFSLIVFMKYASYGKKQILTTGLLILILWPVLTYLPTSSPEPLNQAIGILLAGGFLFIIRNNNEDMKIYHKIGLLIVLIIASLIRMSWSFLIFPFLMLIWNGNFSKRLFFSITVSIVLIISIMWINSYINPPVGNVIYSLINITINNGPKVLMDHMIGQTNRFSLRVNRINLVVTIQLLILVGWSIIRFFSLRKGKNNHADFPLQALPIFNIYNLVILFGFSLFFYLVFGFHRVFIPPIILSSLLLIAWEEYKPIIAIFLVSIIGIMPFYEFYQELGKSFQPDTKEIESNQKAIEEIIVFDEETENPWCNTLLIPVGYYKHIVTLIPSGIGISSIVKPTELNFPLKSKYLLFPQLTYSTEDYLIYSDKLNTEIIATLSMGDIYYNLDSGCHLRE